MYKKSRKVINLFNDRSIQGFKVVFNINDEDDLTDFWSYFFDMQTTFSESRELIDDILKLIFEHASFILREHEGITFDIIVEQSDIAVYFTVWNLEFAERYLENTYKEIHHLFNGARISYKVEKTECELPTSGIKKPILEEPTPKEIELPSQEEESTTQEDTDNVKIHTFIVEEDLSDIKDYGERLEEIAYYLKSKGLNRDTISTYSANISNIANTLEGYPEAAFMSTILKELAVSMNSKQDEILAFGDDIILLLEGFVFDFNRWFDVLFFAGGEPFTFLDATLETNLSTIKQFIDPQEDEGDEELDDIFDF
jgi:hypothetical protein